MDGSRILLTGGAGYIGSHTYLALCASGFSPIILDDFSSSDAAVINRLEKLTGRNVHYVENNILDTGAIKKIIIANEVAAVIHFAAFKSVAESITNPLDYYRNNVSGLISVLHAMDAADCRTLIFSSSATVYGHPDASPIKEHSNTGFTNPYGHTKLVCEEIIANLRGSLNSWRVGILRYFNPVGAHSSGLIGEAPNSIPSNLMPYITQVAVGQLPCLRIYGGDYPTSDGTGVRDYIHVCDLADGHVAALQRLDVEEKDQHLSFTVNLGTGVGYSVKQVLACFEEVSERKIPFEIVDRRIGDVPSCYANVEKAYDLLGWKAQRSLADMCRDAWNWQVKNPNGFN